MQKTNRYVVITDRTNGGTQDLVVDMSARDVYARVPSANAALALASTLNEAAADSDGSA